MKFKTFSLNVSSRPNKEQKIFWLVFLMLFGLLAVYMVLIQSTIYNIVVEKKLVREYRELQSEMLMTEEEYFNYSKDLNLALLDSLGLEIVEKSRIYYAESSGATSLTFLTDAQ